MCDRAERGSDGIPSSHRKPLLKGTGESGMSQKSSMASQYRELRHPCVGVLATVIILSEFVEHTRRLAWDLAHGVT